MTFEEIMLIIADKTKTDRQKGADLEAAFLKAANPSVMNLQPQKQRKARQAKASRPVPTIATQDGEAVGQVGDEAA